MVADVEPHINFMCRKTFTASILLAFAGEKKNKYVINQMKYACCVAIGFDLCMWRGAQDIFQSRLTGWRRN